jgi:hypothetical protein
MTAIKIMTLPQDAMDVAISVATDVLHLWPSLDGYDAMAGVSNIIPDSQIMIQVPEYSKTNPFGAVDKDDKPSQETEERFKNTGWKPVEQTYWAVGLNLPDDVKDKVWKEMNIHGDARNASWTRYYETGVVDWEEVATMAMYPFKPGELMTGPVHYGKRFDDLQKTLKGRSIPGSNLNLYHVVMSYPHPQKVNYVRKRDKSVFREEGFIAVWPFGKNGMENNDMAFLSMQEEKIGMLFGEKAYAAWVKERDKMIGHYASINRQTIF